MLGCVRLVHIERNREELNYSKGGFGAQISSLNSASLSCTPVFGVCKPYLSCCKMKIILTFRGRSEDSLEMSSNTDVSAITKLPGFPAPLSFSVRLTSFVRDLNVLLLCLSGKLFSIIILVHPKILFS